MLEIYILPCALIIGGIMAWAVGANDLANSIGSSVGSKSISLRTGIILAAIFEGCGVLFASNNVTYTLKEELFNVELWASHPEYLAIGMLSVLISGSLWLLIATHKSWPVSTTHTVVGAILGFAIASMGLEAVCWDKIFLIFISWILTPCLSAILSFFVLKIIQYYIFNLSSPLYGARICLPIFASLITLLLLIMTFGERFWIQNINSYHILLISFFLLLPLISFHFSFTWIKKVSRGGKKYTYIEQLDKVEKSFGVLTVFTACAMAFSHGANDIANALGPVAAIFELTLYGKIISGGAMPLFLVIMGAIFVILGLSMYGYKVMHTVGADITNLTPSRAFVSEFSTAIVIMIATFMGLPVSTTQTLVGAVLGVGLARGVGSINLNIVKQVLSSWAFTLPIGAFLSASVYLLLIRVLL